MRCNITDIQSKGNWSVLPSFLNYTYVVQVEVKKAHPLVLQKARAPARRERDLALQAMMQNPGKRRPVRQTSVSHHATGQDLAGAPAWPVKPETNERAAPWNHQVGGGPVIVDPFGISNSALPVGSAMPSLRSPPDEQQLPQFPSAPWNANAGWRQQPYNRIEPMPQRRVSAFWRNK